MRTLAFAVLSVCVLLFSASGPAHAGGYGYGGYGGYYGGGYYRHHRVWYSTDCCFKKIVRHERSSRLVRIDEGIGYGDYYGHRYSRYYDVPRYSYSHYYDYPRRHYSDYGYASYSRACYRTRTRVRDGWGGWIWASERVCD